MITYDNLLVPTELFVNLFVTGFIKAMVFVAIMLTLGTMLLSLFLGGNKEGYKYVIKGVLFWFTIFKIALSITVMSFAFFYRPETQSFIMEIPVQMFLPTLFTGILAFYELITAVYSTINIWFEMARGEY